MSIASTPTLPLSLFELVNSEIGARSNPLRCTKATLVHLSHTLEDIVLRQQLPALMFTGFQESSHWREETERYRALAEVAQQVCIFAGGTLPPESSARELHVTLRGDDPLRQEWFLVILSDRFAVLLCGQDQHEPALEEATRQFDTLWSFDPALIGRVLDRLETIIASYRPERLDALRHARQQFPPLAPDPAIMTDFTAEIIRFEEQLHQSLYTTTKALESQMHWRDDLIATLVHDLRTPLQSLSLTMDLLQTWDVSDRETHTQLFDAAKRNISNLNNLVQLLLDTNQLAAGTLPVMWQAFRPNALLEEATTSIQQLIESNRLALTLQCDPQLILLWGDKLLLARVIQNLVGNAIKFTPPGGQITVGINRAPNADMIEIRVRDTGKGIASTDLKRLFERYTQADGSNRRGNGLGLYFCRLVVEAHGGAIRVASQLGIGTTITFSIPAKAPVTRP